MAKPISKRFVRLLPNDAIAPGYRLRLDREVDESLTTLSEEITLPEKVADVDANHIESDDSIELTETMVRWLHASLGELIAEMDRS